MMKSLPITIDSVRKAYGSYVALNDVSLDISYAHRSSHR